MRLVLSVSLGLLGSVACSDNNFKGDITQKKVTPYQQNDAKPGESKPKEAYSFGLSVENGAAVTRQQAAAAEPQIKYAARDMLLSPEELKAWKVAIFPEGLNGVALTSVETQLVDLNKAVGLTTIQAVFQKDDGDNGAANAVIFVDAEPPALSLSRLNLTEGGRDSELVWTATDNFKLDESKTQLIACSDQPQYAPASSGDIKNLPETCVSLLKGEELHGKGAQIKVSSSMIKGANILARDLHFGIYGEDSVGLGSFLWMTDLPEEKLTIYAAPSGITFTNKPDSLLRLKVLHINNSQAIQVDDDANKQLWPGYSVAYNGKPAKNSPADGSFEREVPVKLGPADGIYTFEPQATSLNSGLISNKSLVTFVYDTIPPKVSKPTITIDKALPSPDSNLAATWTVEELNGVVGQVIEYKTPDDANWVKIADLKGDERSVTFPWGNKPLTKTFEIRVTATDKAGNKGSNTMEWSRQVFNAAVLTSNVQCFFCHTKIVGDVGGIDFPASVHGESGKNFQIIGKIYGTNVVPTQLAKTATGGAVNNYDNSGFKIFPKDAKFPVMTSKDLEGKVQGSLQLGNLMINKVYKGDLILDGTQANKPIVLNGEVLVEGDLIIKGKYRGVGTIYANNIYVVDDLVATKSPFPFSEDEKTAMSQALNSVVRGDDGLYLGSLNQLVVGTLNNNLESITKSEWLKSINYEALGRQADPLKKKDGSNVNCCAHGPNTDGRYRTEVERVDAYLYAKGVVTWRAYSNILLNGGFMAPKGSFVGGAPHVTWDRAQAERDSYQLNPRNGQPITQNLVRYDWRLRIGGGGFETLKTFFEQ